MACERGGNLKLYWDDTEQGRYCRSGALECFLLFVSTPTERMYGIVWTDAMLMAGHVFAEKRSVEFYDSRFLKITRAEEHILGCCKMLQAPSF